MIQTSSETRDTRARRWTPILLLSAAVLVCATPASALSSRVQGTESHQPASAGQDVPPAAPAAEHASEAAPAPADAHQAPAHGEGAAAEEHGDSHGESLGAFLSRIANFLLLAGGLFYLLRSPLANYLGTRATQIKSDLVTAADTRKAAAEELAQIENRMKQLPSEIEALKARGVQEVRAEQERIKQAAAVERDRLLEQARREIDNQLAGARRVLKQDAAELAVGVARRRIAHEITDADRARLIDRYVAQVKTAHD